VSTVKAAAFNHPSASSGGLAISATGLVTGGGLDPVQPASVAYTGTSATITGNRVDFTAVSSLSLNGVFTSAYTDYAFFFRAIGSTVATQVRIRMRLAGTDATTANHDGGYTASLTSAQTELTVAVVSSARYGMSALTVYAPAVAIETGWSGTGYRSDNDLLLIAGRQGNATAYDGFTLNVSSGTFTGSVSIYGYHS